MAQNLMCAVNVRISVVGLYIVAMLEESELSQLMASPVTSAGLAIHLYKRLSTWRVWCA